MRTALRHADLDTFAATVRDRGAGVVIDEVLAELADAPVGVLIGPPLVEHARADAARLDASAPAAPLPLHGIPFVVKDNIDVGAVPTTAACPGFAYVARRDATVVAALRAQGAIVVGKANLDQFATGLVGTRSPYGTPPNALDARLVPGGSSSGSAAAVALGYVPFALGTDTAGSGRVPASLNGIVGVKPTVGRLDTAGMVPAVRRLDCPSVFARTVGDAVKVVAALERATGLRRAVGGRLTAAEHVVGVPARWPADVDVDPVVATAFAEALERLSARGVTLVRVDVAPLVELGAMLYGSALVAERTLAVGEAVADGVDGLDEVVAAIIGRGFGITAVEAYRTEYELARRRVAAVDALQTVDVLALPTTLSVPTLDDVRADPFGVNERLGTLTTFTNLLGLPAVVVPISAEVPVGLQLLGARDQDSELLSFVATI
ncbi:MAG: amidase family protein [Ilumatobacteraceae bacterium]